jgi:hypothetical protein
VVEDKPLKKNEIVDLDRLTKEDQAAAQEELAEEAKSKQVVIVKKPKKTKTRPKKGKTK